MTRSVFVAPSVLALVLTSSIGIAQTPAPGPAPAPARAPAPGAAAADRPSLMPAPTAPGTEGPNASVSQTTLELQARLESMMKGVAGLTADEVAARAVKNSHQLVAKRAELEGAEASVDRAKAAFVPALNLGASYTRLSSIEAPQLGLLAVPEDQTPGPIADGAPLVAVPLTFPFLFNQYVLQAQLNVPLSDYVLRSSRGLQGAKHLRAASELDERATKLSVARDARVAYYQWIRAQGVAFVATQALEQAKGHLNDANNGFQAGLISKADVLRAQSGVKNSELFLQRATSNAQLAVTRLRILMKDESGKPYEVGENVLAPKGPMPNTTDEEAAYREAARSRLELKKLFETEQALHDQAAVIGADNYPRLDAHAGAQYSNPNQRYFPAEEKFHGSWEASIMLSWTPTAIFGATAGTRQVEARAAEVAAQRQGLIDALKMEVSQALRAERDARFAVGVSEQALIATEEGYRVRRELFRGGRATFVEVTDAETELTRDRLELVNSHIALRIAQVELTHALGRDVGK
ncbi:MAG TPA: TolC family protein [Polyangiaceae bacterium]